MLDQFMAVDQLFDQINNACSLSGELEDILQTVAQKVRDYLDIDRVKIYQFDEVGNGQVVAESLTPDRLPSLLGLYFPASDIPSQARELFVQARQRVIVNVASKQKILCPLNLAQVEGKNSSDIDIRYSFVDQCHLDYLTTMGVAASLTIPLFEKAKNLWGLLAIHHSQTYSFSEQQLQLVQLWANLISVALAKANLVHQAAWQNNYLELQSQITNKLIHKLPLSAEAWHSILQTIATTVQADGVRLYLSNCLMDTPSEIYTWGQYQPTATNLEEQPVWEETIQWLQAEFPLESVNHQPHFFKHQGMPDLRQVKALTPVWCRIDETSPLSPAFADSGIDIVLVAPLRYQAQVLGYLSLFRCPQLVERAWAGKYSSDERHQKPRESFAAWTEQYQTTPLWQPQVIQIIQDVAIRLYANIVKQGARKLVTQKSAYDGITHLPKDQLLLHSLSLKVCKAKQTGEEVVLGILGLDRFRLINETFGHPMGNVILRQVAERLRKSLKALDEVMLSTAHLGRWHGDSFVIMLPTLGSFDNIKQISQALLAVFDAPFRLNQQDVYVTASIGWAVAPYNGVTADLLLQHAESAMHQAKRVGSQTFEVYNPMRSKADFSDVMLTAALHEALDRQEFMLYYQPQLDVTKDHVPGVEALIRWKHPKLGVVSPQRFLPIAEETGLILPIGAWVLRQACKQHRLWLDQGIPAVHIAINLSLHQFQDPNLVTKIRTILQEEGVDPRWIELEITEEATTHDLQGTVKQLRSLADYGFSIALDDFGKGYSSLNVLKHFPLHTLKIDRAFIQDLETDASSVAIARTIVALGEGLNLKTVGEGVENANQLKILQSLGCRYVQGYWFSRPLAPAAMTQWLRNRLNLPQRLPGSSSASSAGGYLHPTEVVPSAEIAEISTPVPNFQDTPPTPTLNLLQLTPSVALLPAPTAPSGPGTDLQPLVMAAVVGQRQWQLVSSIALKIRESMDVDDIFNLSVTEVRHLLNTDRVVLFQFDENWVGKMVQESVTPGCQAIINQVIEDRCFRDEYVDYYRQGRVRAIDDIQNAGLAPCHVNLLQTYGVKANLVVPVLYQGVLWGLLIAHHCHSTRAWHERELNILNDLAVHIGIAINQAQLYQNLTLANDELRRLSGEDRLTKLANRHRFDEFMAQEWNRHLRSQSPLAAIFCDADNFKAYNDLYGHSQGDLCLQQIARAMLQAIKRSSDFVARYGGEEFVLLLPDTDSAGAALVANRILEGVRRLNLPHARSTHGIVTVSLGVASLVPSADNSARQLIEQADTALYQVKRGARNSVCIFAADHDPDPPV